MDNCIEAVCEFDLDKVKEEKRVVNADEVIREHYMAKNIQAYLKVPGLVKVGRGHIKGLKKLLEGTKAKPYRDYGDFEKATKAETVLG